MALDWNKILPDLLKTIPALLGALTAVATQIKSFPPTVRALLAAVACLFFLVWALLALRSYESVWLKALAITLLIVCAPSLLFFSGVSAVLAFTESPTGDGKVVFKDVSPIEFKGEPGTASADEPDYKLRFRREADYVRVIFKPHPQDESLVREFTFFAAGDASHQERITVPEDHTYVIRAPTPVDAIPFDMHIELKEKAERPSVRVNVIYEYVERDTRWRIVKWTHKTFGDG